MSFIASRQLGDKPSTSHYARRQRAERAFFRMNLRLPSDAEIYPLGSQASSSVVHVRALRVLISYETCVAYAHADGSCVATPCNHYSRTTDRAIEHFVRPTVRLSVQEFADSLFRLLS